MIELALQRQITTNFTKAKTKFCLSLHYNDDCNLFVRRKIEMINKDRNFPTQFCLGKISKKFYYVESKEVSPS